MLRALAAVLLACQALPFSAVLFCAGHRQAEAACAEMADGPTLPGMPQLHPVTAPSPHNVACPIAQLCSNGSVPSLPLQADPTSVQTPTGSLVVPPARQVHAADATAPPLHPPKA